MTAAALFAKVVVFIGEVWDIFTATFDKLLCVLRQWKKMYFCTPSEDKQG